MRQSTGSKQDPREGGYALLVVMVLVSAMLIMGTGFFSLVSSEVRGSQNQLDSERAFWLAEAGKERALRFLSTLPIPPSRDFAVYVDEAGPDGGTYSVNCLVDTTAAWLVEKAFVLDCIGESGNAQRRVRQWVKMTSFSQYAMFTHEESNGQYDLWYISGDEVEGMLHSNGTYHLYGDPIFHDRITSSSDHIVAYPNRSVSDMADWPVGGNDPYFGGGVELNVPVIPMPTELPDLRNLGMFGGLYSGTDTEIELGVSGNAMPTVAPGWLRYREHGTTDPWTSVEIVGLTNPIFYSEGDVHIEGILDGELTVVSHRNINIDDDILYYGSDASGAPPVDCDDLLGLVAERNVIISDTPANGTDCRINGVLMALDTSISVENYDSGAPRGTLAIWGGLIQKYRGPVGQTRGGTVIHGYVKGYHYDARVTARTPPSYPLTGVYEKLAWEETWDATNPF